MAAPAAPEVLVKTAEGVGQAEADILKAIAENRERSARTRRSRFQKNEDNWNAILGEQDWSHKLEGQSREFLPDLPMAFEQQAGIIENALTGSRNWFDVTWPGYAQPPFDVDSARKLLQYHLDRLYEPGQHVETARNFAVALGEGVRHGLAEATVTLKVYGVDVAEPRYRIAIEPVPGEPYYRAPQRRLDVFTRNTFRLAVQAIPYEDFYPDPSSLRAFDIHEVSRGLHELRANGDYNQDVVDALQAHWSNQQEERRRKQLRQAEDEPDTTTIRLQEHWGDVIDYRDGRMLARNKLITVVPGGGRFLRDPVDNPAWGGKRPFVTAALLPLPNATVHRAILDLAAPVARAVNELANLMLDQAMLSTWGNRQIRPYWLENEDEIGDGVPPNFTAILKPGTPENVKWMERCDSGELPQYAENMLRRFERSFSIAMAVPQMSQGVLTPRQVKATEIVEMLESVGSLFEAIASRLQVLVQAALELAWQTIWQYLDDFSRPELTAVLGPQRAFALAQMTAAERWFALTQGVSFQVTGLRAIAQRAQQLRSIVLLLQTVAASPPLAQAWSQRFSFVKALDRMVRALNLDPVELEKDQGAGPEFDPRLLLAGRGSAVMGGTGGPESQIEAGFAAANPEGFRGAQV